jgi:HK97 family phage portal protein
MGIFQRKTENRDYKISEALFSFNSAYYKTSDSSQWQGLQAIENEAVFAACKIISETVAALPISIYKKTARGPEKQINHNLAKVLNDPEPNINKFNFWETFVFNVALYGNGYAYISRWPQTGAVKDLVLLDSSVIIPYRDKSGVKKFKNIRTGKIFPKEQIFHVMATSLDGIEGLNLMALFKLQIAEGLGADEYVRRFFDRGNMGSNVITLPEGFSKGDPDENQKRITAMKAGFAKLFGGVNNSHEPILVDAGTKVEALKADTNRDSQVLELRKESVIKVARIFRIPPHMLMSLDKATFSNISQQSADFYKQCALPWIERIESAIESQLIFYSDRSETYVKFNATSVLRGTDSERKDFYSAMYNIGALSINEIRALEELPRLEAEYADYHLYNKGYGFIEKPGEDLSEKNKE